MRHSFHLGATSLFTAICAGLLPAQDSVSKTNCLPGDAVDPWADAAATNGSEQSNSYVVDLVPIKTSWGGTFGLAPLLKSSKVDSTYFNAQINAQALSRTQLSDTPIGGSFSVWSQAGGGVNNDATLNNPGSAAPLPANRNTFAAAFAEYGTTDTGFSYAGIVSGVVLYDPIDPGRLYVNRRMVAINGDCRDSELGTMSMGAVDASGNVIFRADDYSFTGMIGVTCAGGLKQVQGNNIFMVNSNLRNPANLNVLSDDYPMGLFDPGFAAIPTQWLLQRSGTAHNTPNIGRVGGGPFYIGSNFNTEYVRGASAGTIKSDMSHLAPGVSDHRGNVARLEQNHPALPGANGLAAMIGYDGGGNARLMNVWSLDASGDVAAKTALMPAAVITDPFTGDTNKPGTNEFDHYHSQIAFQGSAQLSMNVDAAGNLLVAGVMDHPGDGGPDWHEHFIPVAKVDPSGSVSWMIAAYNSAPANPPNNPSGLGKPILDGSGGNTIGRLTTLDKVTGGTPRGPSFSAPMIDSAGNVYFLSAVELFGNPSVFTTALVRAVYDPVKSGYEIELVFKLGDVIKGANSGTNYLVRYMEIADSNSASSATAWSTNISEQGHNGQEHAAAPTASSLNLGGLVIHASIIYDLNGDGMYQRCSGTSPAFPNSPDQDYEVLLYLGSLEDCQLNLGFQGPGTSELTMCGSGLKMGESSNLTLTGAAAGQSGVFLASLPGQPDLNIFGGTVASFAGLIGAVPVVVPPGGTISFAVNGQPNTVDLVLQYVTVDPSLPQLVSFSNALLAKFGQ